MIAETGCHGVMIGRRRGGQRLVFRVFLGAMTNSQKKNLYKNVSLLLTQ